MHKKQQEPGFSSALTYYGVGGERAAEIVNFVDNRYALAVIETNSTKSREVANLLNKYGGHLVENWSKAIEKPIKPWN